MIFPGFPGVLSFFQVFQVKWEPWFLSRGLCWGGSVSRGISVWGGLCPEGSLYPLYGKERAVCILLECNLVFKAFTKTTRKHSRGMCTVHFSDSGVCAHPHPWIQPPGGRPHSPAGFPLDLENLEKWEYIWKTWKYQGILKNLIYHGKITWDLEKLGGY